MRIAPLAAAALLLLASPARAADPEHVRRALDTSSIQQCANCDLTNHDFSRAFLHFANLYASDLSGSNFYGAEMAGALLMETNLTRASFVRTNLSGANFENAVLDGADLSNAWLNHAHLKGARLNGANLSGANLRGVQIQGADLSSATGLTQSQLKDACGSLTTKLPPGLRFNFC